MSRENLMRFISQLTFISCFILLYCPSLLASHLVGGDGSYTFIEFNSDSTTVTYNVRFDLYRDSYVINGANLNPRETFGIYRKNEFGEWDFVRDFTARRSGNLVDIPAIDEPCREEPTGTVGVETAFYEETITLEVIDFDYMVVYMRCCRNDNITNMYGDASGAVFDLIITSLSQKTGNSSPTFNSFPPIFICAGFDLDVDLSCSDMEGDDIIYSFCTPISEGSDNFNGAACDMPNPPPSGCPPPYDEVLYKPGFTAAAPMAGNPTVMINPITGLITGVPETTGLYIVGVCIKEYRDGELLSVLRRDFQFNALTCVKEISASLEADEVIIDNSTGISRPVSLLKACGDSLVQFSGIDINTTIIDYSWQIIDPSDEIIVDTSGFLVRNLEVYFPELGEYNGRLVVTDSEGCVDTAFLSVLRLPDMETKFEYEVLDSCYLGQVQFTDLSIAEQSEIVKWDWNFAGENTSTEKDPSFEFGTRGPKKVTLISEDLNTCIDTFETFVMYEPPHDRLLIANPNVPLCYGDSIFFDDRWIKTAGDYSDTLRYAETNCDSVERYLSLSFYEKPNETYIDTVICPGEVVDYYGVIYSENGTFSHQTPSKSKPCDSILHFIKLEYEILPEITVSEDFIYVTANKDFNLPIRYQGNYSQAIWTPSDGLSCDDCPYPTLNFDTDTTYKVTLVTDDNCKVADSIYIDFKVVPDGYYVPNILDKNSINADDSFLFLQTTDTAINDVRYSLKVFDRWGGLLHDGKNLTINERNQGFSARLVESGSYVYLMEIEEFFEVQSLVGTITIID